MESLDDKEISLMCDYLSLEFPKGRVKVAPKRFGRAVIIPFNYTNNENMAYPYSNKEEMQILFPILKGILTRVFSFNEENTNKAILKHFKLL